MDLEQFRREVRQRVAAANGEPKWTVEAAAQYMAGLEPRRKRFVEVARHLVTDLIEPRMAVVAEPFGNTQADRNAHQDHKGHPYFFCSTACRGRFDAAPEHYVTVRV